MINKKRLLDRFLKYVQVETAASTQSDTYPSTRGQLELGSLLVDELQAIGIGNAHQDANGLVRATLASNLAIDAPAILLNSHLDTSPEAPGANVRPRVIESYDGQDIPLEFDGHVITRAACPALNELVGKTLVVTDGRTLLGSDDKAGVAAIMELVQTLVENPSIPHGRIEALFTCDEEIGHGTDRVDLEALAADVGYTLDGGGQGEIDEETFSADLATVTFEGHNIHPAIAKDRMRNAVRAASIFVSRMPIGRLSPESTDGRDGFLHPYELQAGVGSAKLQILLRDFDAERLSDYASLLEEIAEDVEAEVPGVIIRVHRQTQYRNMAEGLTEVPQVVDLAVEAFRKLGIEAKKTIVRGGTDGSQFTAKGLPTPNLSVGQHNIHSVLEFACVDEMVIAVRHLIELVQLWSQVDRKSL